MIKSAKIENPVFKMDDLIFDVNLYRETKPWTVKPHSHSYIEIMICVDGECEHVVDDVSMRLKCGDVFIMHPGAIHELIIDNIFEHVTIACTIFAPETVAPELKSNEDFKKLFAPVDPQTALLHLSPLEYDIIKKLVDEMLCEFSDRAMGWQALMRSCFSAIVGQLTRFKARQGLTGNILPRLAPAITYMENNFTHEIKLCNLAKKAGLSECQFVRLFRKAYGDSPINYLINLRVAHAKRLLLLNGRNLSISEIAYASGFNDSNYFDRQFKKITGFTPLQYKHQR